MGPEMESGYDAPSAVAARAPEAQPATQPVAAGGEEFTIHTSVINGIDALPVDARVTLGPVDPKLNDGLRSAKIEIMGIPEGDALEARAIARTALRASNMMHPGRDLAVSFEPAGKDVSPRQIGMGFAGKADQAALPVALALAVASGYTDTETFKGMLLTGSLGLQGELSPIAFGQAQTAALASREHRILAAPVGQAALPEHAGAVRCYFDITELADDLTGPDPLERPGEDARLIKQVVPPRAECGGCGLEDVIAQAVYNRTPVVIDGRGLSPASVRDAAEKVGRAMADARGEMDESELMHRASMLTLSGGKLGNVLVARPVAVLTGLDSITRAVGGGRPVRPGMAAVASGGVLLVEGLDSISPLTAIGLKDAMDSKGVTIKRSYAEWSMPADFLLVATCDDYSKIHDTARASLVSGWDARGPEVISGKEVAAIVEGDVDMDEVKEALKSFEDRSFDIGEALTVDTLERDATSRAEIADGHDL